MQHAILASGTRVIRAVRDYFDSHGFILADTPIFTPAACEGTTSLFEVNYFDDEKAYLTQSGQLYNEATAAAFGRAYAFGPTFRAEKSKTRRHLTEFWMVEPEVAYATLDDILGPRRGLPVLHCRACRGEPSTGLETLGRDISKLGSIRKPFPRISYDEAAKMLADGGQAFEYGGDFGAPDETFISAKFDRPSWCIAIRPP